MLTLETIKQRLSEVEKIPNEVDSFTAEVLFFKENNKTFRLFNEEIYFPRINSSQFPKEGDSLFRITRYYSSIDITKVSSFHHPPSHLTTGQRCNIPKHPAFYCSYSPFFSLLETLQGNFETAIGKLFYLSEWKVSVSREWKILGIIFGDMLDGNPFLPMKKEYIEMVQKACAEKIGNGQFKEYNDYLYEEFVKEGDHIVSSHTAHDFLYEDKNDLIIYPSAQGNGYNCNLAFNKENIDNSNIKMNRIFSFFLKDFRKVGDLDYEYKIEPISIAECENNKIFHWKMMNEKDLKSFENMFKITNK